MSSRGGNRSAAAPAAHNPALSMIKEHAFLQAVMQRGYMSESEAKRIYKMVYSKEFVEAEYFEMLSNINSRLTFANFELRRAQFSGDNHFYLGFVNREADEPSKLATKFRNKEGKPDIRYAAYFRAVLEALAMQEDAPEGLNKLTEREALMLAAPVTVPAADSGGADGAGPSTAAGAGTLPPLRNVDKEEALDVFVTDGWLGRHPDQGYCLGPRSLLELGPMILEMDVPDATRQAVNKALGYDA